MSRCGGSGVIEHDCDGGCIEYGCAPGRKCPGCPDCEPKDESRDRENVTPPGGPTNTTEGDGSGEIPARSRRGAPDCEPERSITVDPNCKVTATIHYCEHSTPPCGKGATMPTDSRKIIHERDASPAKLYPGDILIREDGSYWRVRSSDANRANLEPASAADIEEACDADR